MKRPPVEGARDPSSDEGLGGAVTRGPVGEEPADQENDVVEEADGSEERDGGRCAEPGRTRQESWLGMGDKRRMFGKLSWHSLPTFYLNVVGLNSTQAFPQKMREHERWRCNRRTKARIFVVERVQRSRSTVPPNASHSVPSLTSLPSWRVTRANIQPDIKENSGVIE